MTNKQKVLMKLGFYLSDENGKYFEKPYLIIKKFSKVNEIKDSLINNKINFKIINEYPKRIIII